VDAGLDDIEYVDESGESDDAAESGAGAAGSGKHLRRRSTTKAIDRALSHGFDGPTNGDAGDDANVKRNPDGSIFVGVEGLDVIEVEETKVVEEAELQRTLGNKVLLACVVIFLVLYPALIQKCLLMMKCDNLDYGPAPNPGDPDGVQSRLYSDRSIDCESESHQRYSLAAMIIGALYGIGIPVSISLTIYATSLRRGFEEAMQMFAFYTAGYAETFWWWEGMILIRKLGIISIAVFVTNETLRLYAVMWFLSVMVLSHMSAHPYPDGTLHHTETMSLSTIIITLNLALLLEYTPEGSAGFIALAVTMVLLNLFAVGAIIVLILLEVKKMFSEITAKYGGKIGELWGRFPPVAAFRRWRERKRFEQEEKEMLEQQEHDAAAAAEAARVEAETAEAARLAEIAASAAADDHHHDGASALADSANDTGAAGLGVAAAAGRRRMSLSSRRASVLSSSGRGDEPPSARSGGDGRADDGTTEDVFSSAEDDDDADADRTYDFGGARAGGRGMSFSGMRRTTSGAVTAPAGTASGPAASSGTHKGTRTMSVFAPGAAGDAMAGIVAMNRRKSRHNGAARRDAKELRGVDGIGKAPSWDPPATVEELWAAVVDDDLTNVATLVSQVESHLYVAAGLTKRLGMHIEDERDEEVRNQRLMEDREMRRKRFQELARRREQEALEEEARAEEAAKMIKADATVRSLKRRFGGGGGGSSPGTTMLTPPQIPYDGRRRRTSSLSQSGSTSSRSRGAAHSKRSLSHSPGSSRPVSPSAARTLADAAAAADPFHLDFGGVQPDESAVALASPVAHEGGFTFELSPPPAAAAPAMSGSGPAHHVSASMTPAPGHSALRGSSTTRPKRRSSRTPMVTVVSPRYADGDVTPLDAGATSEQQPALYTDVATPPGVSLDTGALAFDVSHFMPEPAAEAAAGGGPARRRRPPAGGSGSGSGGVPSGARRRNQRDPYAAVNDEDPSLLPPAGGDAW
jgi:hypothetical protein